jgi:hypothetical protein
MPPPALEGYLHPPDSPRDCIFARTTTCLSADLERRIEPCQFGGTPDCAQCGCFASAGLAAIGRYRLFGAIPVSRVFDASDRVGAFVRGLRTPKGGARGHAEPAHAPAAVPVTVLRDRVPDPTPD